MYNVSAGSIQNISVTSSHTNLIIKDLDDDQLYLIRVSGQTLDGQSSEYSDPVYAKAFGQGMIICTVFNYFSIFSCKIYRHISHEDKKFVVIQLIKVLMT